MYNYTKLCKYALIYYDSVYIIIFLISLRVLALTTISLCRNEQQSGAT